MKIIKSQKISSTFLVSHERKPLRAFASRIVNAICKVYLAFFPQKPPTSKMLYTKYCKKIYNTATVQF